MNRRGFLSGILAAGIAPYVVTAAGVLMPVRQILTPRIVHGRMLFVSELWGHYRTVNEALSAAVGGDSIIVIPGNLEEVWQKL